MKGCKSLIHEPNGARDYLKNYNSWRVRQISSLGRRFQLAKKQSLQAHLPKRLRNKVFIIAEGRIRLRRGIGEPREPHCWSSATASLAAEYPRRRSQATLSHTESSDLLCYIIALMSLPKIFSVRLSFKSEEIYRV